MMAKKTARRAAPRVTPMPRSRLVRLDKKRCERAAGVEFDARAWVELEWLAEYCVLYANSGAEGRRVPLPVAKFMMEHWSEPLTREQRADILPMLVAEVAEVWRTSGGTKRELLTRLVKSLFQQAGVRLPAARTLRDAVARFYNRKSDPLPPD